LRRTFFRFALSCRLPLGYGAYSKNRMARQPQPKSQFKVTSRSTLFTIEFMLCVIPPAIKNTAPANEKLSIIFAKISI
jgi:hypothetical protein